MINSQPNTKENELSIKSQAKSHFDLQPPESEVGLKTFCLSINLCIFARYSKASSIHVLMQNVLKLILFIYIFSSECS